MTIWEWLKLIFTRPQPQPQPQPQPTDDISKQQIFVAINKQRTTRGLPQLAEDVTLDNAAQGWANRMAQTNTLSHGNFAQRIPHKFPYAGEDIAEAPNANVVINLWMTSPPHRANILGNYTVMGIGIAKANNGDLYWNVDFGREL